MQDLTGKITGSTLTAAEWNQLPQEVQNVITALGITLGSGDLNQLGKAIAGYVANGTFYTDSGVANAYVLTQIGSKQALTSYTDGATFEFETSNPNTGAATVNVAGLGVKNIKLADGSNPIAGTIDGRVTLKFDAGNDWAELTPVFESPIGVGQTWQDVSGSRAVNVTYTNTTGKAIMVSISGSVTTNLAYIEVDGVRVGSINDDGAITNRGTVNFIVPDGSSYIWLPGTSTGSTIDTWSELR